MSSVGQVSLYEHLLAIEEARLAPFIVVDTEGNGQRYDVRCHPDYLTVGISISWPGCKNEGHYFPFNHKHDNLPSEVLALLKDLLLNTPFLVFHHVKHDLVALKRIGIDLFHKKYYCTMLMAHWVNENLVSKELDFVSQHYGGNPKKRNDAFNAIVKAFGWEYVPPNVMDEYASNDAFITKELFESIYPRFKEEGYDNDLFHYWEHEFIEMLIKMEGIGIGVDLDFAEKEIVEGELRLREIETELGCNPNSPNALHNLLINILGLPVVKRTPKGRPSFDKFAMEEYEELLEHRKDETAKLVFEYRGWTKTLSSNYKAYFELLGHDGYLRPNYMLHRARTRRLSCEKPNLQQIPRSSPKRWNGNLKRAFVPRPGYLLWEADYKNLELRLAALYAGEEALLDAFWSGVDVFQSISDRVSWPRYECKTFCYATLYGGGNTRIATIFGISLDEARTRREEFFAEYPALLETIYKASRLATKRGYVKTWTGWRRHFKDPYEEAHKAFNAIIQGGAAEIVKRSMVRLKDVIDWDECKALLQVHDSVVFEIKEGTEDKWLPIIREIMEDVKSLHEVFKGCPFPVDIKQWGE